MRFYAYGGWISAVRRTFGRWPDDMPQGAFINRTGLESGVLRFGSARFGDEYALIARTRQHEENRAGYAYTLLIDPGPEHWARFEWNAARLARALFGPASLASGELLERPEDFDEAHLADVLAALQVPGAPAGIPPGTPNTVALFATAVRTAQPLRVAPAAFGCAALPDLPLLDAVLDDLPVFLRTGRGWFVGGDPTAAAALGCGLLVHDEATGAVDTQLGERLIAAMHVAERTAPVRAMRHLYDVPLAGWPQPTGPAFDDLERLAALSAPEPVPDALWGSLGSNPSELLGRGVREAALERALRADESLGPQGTRFLLERGLARECAIPEATFARLDADAARALLIERGIVNNPPPEGCELPEKLRHELVRAWIEEPAAPTAERLEAALGALRPKEREALAVEVVIAARGRGVPLSAWYRFAAEHAELAGVIDTLRAAAVTQAPLGTPGWELDYAALAGDTGARALAEREPDGEALVRALADALVRALNGPHAELARATLAAMGDSPARARLELDRRIQIARLVERGWESLSTLTALVAGQDVKPAGLPKGQVEALLQELAQLIAHPFQNQDPPRLKTLALWLGDHLSPELKDALAALDPMLTAATLPEWIAGLALIGRRPAVRRVTENYAARRRREVAQQAAEWVAGQTGFGRSRRKLTAEDIEPTRERLVALLELAEGDDTHARGTLEKLLTGWARDTIFNDALYAAYQLHVKDKPNKPAFARLVFDDPALADLLIDALPKKKVGVVVKAIVALERPRAGEFLAGRLIKADSAWTGQRVGPLEAALLDLVKDRKDAELAHDVEQRWKGKTRNDRFNAHVKERLDQYRRP